MPTPSTAESHKCLGSDIKTINLSTQNINATRTFQTFGFHNKFNNYHGWREMGETRRFQVHKPFLK
jgi:hypothetical protein